MYSGKGLGQEWTLEEFQHWLDILVKTSHSELLEATFY